MLWIIFDPTEWDSYILHDQLYTDHCVSFENIWEEISRQEADEILYHALLDEGCPKWKAISVYLGVRIGGWYKWNS